MFKHLNAAVERIAYQPNSPLAKDLVSLFDDVFASVKETTDGYNKRKLTHGQMMYLSRKLNNTFAPKLIRIVERHTDLVTEFRIRPHGCVNAVIIPKFKEAKVRDILTGYARMSGTSVSASRSSIPDIFTKLTASFDRVTGKVGKGFKDLYTPHIEISLEAFLMPYEYEGTAVADVNGTSMAAVYLHELGHAITFAEKLGEHYYRATESLDSISLMSSAADNEAEAKVFMRETRKQVAAIPDSKQRAGYMEILDSAEKSGDYRKSAAACGFILVDVIIAFTTTVLVLTLIKLVIGGALSMIMAPIGWGAFKNISTLIDAAQSATSKSSDTIITGRNNSVTERIADEYVSRHGLSSELMRFLRLLDTEEYTAKRNQATLTRVLSSLGGFIRQCNSIMLPPPMDIPGATPYDRVLTRMELLAQNNMSIFKQIDLPKEVRDEWIKETEASLDELKKYKAQWPDKLRRFMWETVLKLTKPDTSAGALLNANLAADYERLQNLTRNLIRNQLYFQAARVQSLIDESNSRST